MSMSGCHQESYLWNYTSDLHQLFVHVTYGRGSVLLWWPSDLFRSCGLWMTWMTQAEAARLRCQAEAVRVILTRGLGVQEYPLQAADVYT